MDSPADGLFGHVGDRRALRLRGGLWVLLPQLPNRDRPGLRRGKLPYYRGLLVDLVPGRGVPDMEWGAADCGRRVLSRLRVDSYRKHHSHTRGVGIGSFFAGGPSPGGHRRLSGLSIYPNHGREAAAFQRRPEAVLPRGIARSAARALLGGDLGRSFSKRRRRPPALLGARRLDLGRRRRRRSSRGGLRPFPGKHVVLQETLARSARQSPAPEPLARKCRLHLVVKKRRNIQLFSYATVSKNSRL